MQLSTITMDREEAHERYLEYSAHARKTHAKEAAELARGYRALAKGATLIDLRKCLEAGGLVDVQVERTGYRYVDGKDVWGTWVTKAQLPALACIRADQTECRVRYDSQSRAVTFSALQWPRRGDNIAVRVECDLAVLNSDGARWLARVPTVPPRFMPPHHLRNYHILWEAEWTGEVSIDPALLKRVAGDVFVVLATWDLTPLEAAVLRSAELPTS